MNELFRAVGRDDVCLVESLIDKGYDVHAVAPRGGWNLLHSAAVYAGPAVIQSLIAAGADVNARTWNGWTPLHFAAQRNLDVVKALHNAGADVNAKDYCFGKTPLHFATHNNIDPVIEYLKCANALS